MSRQREPNSVAVLLRIPVFRRLWSAIAISSLGDWLGLLATTALAAYLTKDSSNLAQGAAVSGVLLTRLLPDLILGPIAGALVDRFDRRKVAIVGDSLAGLLYLSIILTGNLLWLLVAQFLVEAIGLFSTPAKQAMWVNIVPRERLAVANQLNYVSVYGMVPVAAALFALLSTLASFFGVPDVSGSSGALISGTTSTLAIDIALAIDAGTYFFSAGMVFLSRRLIPPFVGDRSSSKNIFSLIAEGVSFVRKNRLMRSIYVGILGAFFAGGLVAGVAQAYVATLGAGNAGYGILFGSVFTGLALGMLVGPKVFPTVPRRMIFTPAIGAAGISLIVMSVLQDFIGAVVAASVMGAFAGIAWINGFTMIGHEVTDQLRGRVFAFVMSSVRIVLLMTIAAGPILAGAIGSYPVTVGDFRFEITGPAIVLGVGGLIAFSVSLYTGRQIGGLTTGVFRRIFGRRGVNIWDEQDDHAGVLIAVEGADRAAVTEYADRIDKHLRTGGWLIARVSTEPSPPGVHHTLAGPGAVDSPLVDFAFPDSGPPVLAVPDSTAPDDSAAPDSPAPDSAVPDPVSTGSATVFAPAVPPPESPADALRAAADLADLTSRRLRPPLQAGAVVVCEGFVDATIARQRAAGMEEQRLARVTQWAVNGLKADLTVLVDGVLERAGYAPESQEHHSTPADAHGDGNQGDDDEEIVEPVQAYRDRASYTPERYLIVRPLSEEGGVINAEVVERISSVLRQRSPSLAQPHPVDPVPPAGDDAPTEPAAPLVTTAPVAATPPPAGTQPAVEPQPAR